MPDERWSWFLTAWTVAGMWIAGGKKRQIAGWTVCLLGEIPWSIYAVVTHQWGFLLGALVFSSVYAANIWRARGIYRGR